MTAAVVVLAVVVVVLVSSVLVYNGLVRRRDQVDDAWNQIDMQLRRRSDLIPSLVETVDGYAGHERGTLEAVTEARAKAISAHGPADQGSAESALTGALTSLFAVVESYRICGPAGASWSSSRSWRSPRIAPPMPPPVLQRRRPDL
ncbi:MAG: LemA family protein [Actinomycetes bacterium]